MNLFIQGIGIIGIIMGVLAYQCNEHKKILCYRIMNELCFAVQYALLGAYAGCFINLVVCIRNLLFQKAVEQNKNTSLLILFFCVIFVLTTYLTWPGPSGFIIIATKVISTLAFGNKNPKQLRILNLLSGVLWLLYNITIRSYTGVFCELLSIFSIVIAVIRFDRVSFHQKNIAKYE